MHWNPLWNVKFSNSLANKEPTTRKNDWKTNEKQKSKNDQMEDLVNRCDEEMLRKNAQRTNKKPLNLFRHSSILHIRRFGWHCFHSTIPFHSIAIRCRCIPRHRPTRSPPPPPSSPGPSSSSSSSATSSFIPNVQYVFYIKSIKLRLINCRQISRLITAILSFADLILNQNWHMRPPQSIIMLCRCRYVFCRLFCQHQPRTIPLLRSRTHLVVIVRSVRSVGSIRSFFIVLI